MIQLRPGQWACLAIIAASLHLHAAEAPWQWQPTLVPHALLIEGLWTDTFRLREAVHAAGLPYDAAYKSRSAYWRPMDRLIGLPADWSGYAVVVLSNIDAITLTPDRLALLDRFVREGGGLVVLGGYWAYHRGAYAGTPLAELLPVTWPEENRITPAYEGLPLSRAATASWPLAHDFGAAPRAFFVQTLVPREGATVQLLAGDRPAIVTGARGRGRVVAIALTAHGEAPGGALAFWDWPAWPALLGDAIDWAAGARPEVGPGALPPGINALPADPTLADDLLAVDLEPEALTPELLQRALRRLTPEVAEALFKLAAGSSTRAVCKLAELESALRPFAKPAWSEALRPLTDRLNADTPQRQAALRLLGATRDPAAYPVLLAALEDDKVSLAAVDGLGLLGDARALPLLRLRHERALAAARFAGDPADFDTEELARDHGHQAAAAALALYRLGDPEGVARLLDIHALLGFYLRVYRNAGKRRVLETDVQGLAIRQQLWDRAKRLEETVARLTAEAVPIPPGQTEAVLAASRACTDPAQARLLASLLERAAPSLPPASLASLSDAPDGIIRRLAGTAAGPAPR